MDPQARRASRSRVPVEKFIEAQAWDELTPHLERAGADVGRAIDQLKRFAARALEWNQGISNLISRNDEHRIVSRHVRESVEPAYWLKESGAARWIDFGSGAGFPAIPLAIVGVGERWTLVEARRPKALFMRKAIEEIGLKQIEVFHGRLESLIEERRDEAKYEGFCSRATMRLTPTLELAKRIVKEGGYAFLWKGSRREEELGAAVLWEGDWDQNGLLEIGNGAIAIARFVRRA